LTPIPDLGKAGSRRLPQPVSFATVSRPSLLDMRGPPPGTGGINLPPISKTGELGDAQRSANWPALLRATELAREAALKGKEARDQDESP